MAQYVLTMLWCCWQLILRPVAFLTSTLLGNVKSVLTTSNTTGTNRLTCLPKHGGVIFIFCLVRRDRYKIKAPLSFFPGDHKRRLNTHAWDRLRSDGDRITTYHVYSIPHRQAILVKASGRNIRDWSATASGIKREWYECIFFYFDINEQYKWVVF
jgi:hypothetical protein